MAQVWSWGHGDGGVLGLGKSLMARAQPTKVQVKQGTKNPGVLQQGWTSLTSDMKIAKYQSKVMMIRTIMY